MLLGGATFGVDAVQQFANGEFLAGSMSTVQGLFTMLSAGRSCFAAGTPLRMADGTSKPIEEIGVGEMVLSRDEHSPESPASGKVVEEVFVRTAEILRLTLTGGVTIGTTGEHPFFEESLGWIEARSLTPGHRLRKQDGSAIAEEPLAETGKWQPVYTLRVADCAATESAKQRLRLPLTSPEARSIVNQITTLIAAYRAEETASLQDPDRDSQKVRMIAELENHSADSAVLSFLLEVAGDPNEYDLARIEVFNVLYVRRIATDAEQIQIGRVLTKVLRSNDDDDNVKNYAAIAAASYMAVPEVDEVIEKIVLDSQADPNLRANAFAAIERSPRTLHRIRLFQNLLQDDQFSQTARRILGFPQV
ncbi:hypothetical protein, partial : Uncharacterized protein (Fragment) OS=Paenibacillus alvei TS-15 GN=PAALTS15_05618 PE=4 SV=1: PT-HINT [Tuwongella immobilis]|uniref:Hint domain-containing protein n=2 Tax=Tuwongella immobilis TaxID=692036 RepID=A0A6C2YLJ8_9BACT